MLVLLKFRAHYSGEGSLVVASQKFYRWRSVLLHLLLLVSSSCACQPKCRLLLPLSGACSPLSHSSVDRRLGRLDPRGQPPQLCRSSAAAGYCAWLLSSLLALCTLFYFKEGRAGTAAGACHSLPARRGPRQKLGARSRSSAGLAGAPGAFGGRPGGGRAAEPLGCQGLLLYPFFNPTARRSTTIAMAQTAPAFSFGDCDWGLTNPSRTYTHTTQPTPTTNNQPPTMFKLRLVLLAVLVAAVACFVPPVPKGVRTKVARLWMCHGLDPPSIPYPNPRPPSNPLPHNPTTAAPLRRAPEPAPQAGRHLFGCVRHTHPMVESIICLSSRMLVGVCCLGGV